MRRLGRNSQLIRQWQIVRELQTSRRGVRICELAVAHRVHWRTIARDIEALEAAGFPLYQAEGRWRVLFREATAV